MGYLKLLAPYDGIIVARNANTWDFVLPSTGDPTAEIRAPDLSPSGQAAPIYVVDRTDIVRIYVDIPERDANYVHIGSEARVKIWAYRDEWLPATVTRLSWALNTKSRTMRAEIDLPNPGSQILPGMYAYGKVVVERPDVRALPKSALTHAGGKSFIWRYENGHAVRTEVQTGVSDGEWIEVTNRRIKSKSARRGTMGTDRPLGTGAHGQQAVNPHRRRSRAAGRVAGAGSRENLQRQRLTRREPVRIDDQDDDRRRISSWGGAMTEGEQDRGTMATGTTVIASSDVHDADIARARGEDDEPKRPAEERDASQSQPGRREEPAHADDAGTPPPAADEPRQACPPSTTHRLHGSIRSPWRRRSECSSSCWPPP